MKILGLRDLVLKDSLLEQICLFLRDLSVEVYLVGGYVRDRLLGRPSQDMDFVVRGDAVGLAREVADCWGGSFVLLDKERGVGRALLRDEGGQRLFIDFACLRGGSIDADLSSRDFTINAIAVNISDLERSRFIDPYGGQDDLRAGLVRALSEAVFRYDPLRTLRAVRLAAELGLRLEPQTEDWIQRDASLLSFVSAERARDELSKIVAQPGAADHLRRLDDLGLLTVLIPELEPTKGLVQPPPHHLEVFEHLLETVRALENLCASWVQDTGYQVADARCQMPDLGILEPWAGHLADHLTQPTTDGRIRWTTLKLIALLHDVEEPLTMTTGKGGHIRFFNHERKGAALAETILKRLRFGADEMKLAQTVIANHMRPLQLMAQHVETPRAIYRFFRDTGDAGVDALLLCLADQLATWGSDLRATHWRRWVEMIASFLSAYYERRAEIVAPPRLISGRDLIEELGLEEGPRLGQLLEAVREAQVEGEVRTKEEALKMVRGILEKSKEVELNG